MAQVTLPPAARIHAGLAHGLEWIWPAGAAWAWADAVARAPDQPDLHFLRGRALGRIGRWAEAVPALARATHLDPSSLEYQGALAIALERTGRHGALVDALRRFAHLCPGEGEPQLLIGVVLRRTGRPAGAMRAFRRAVQLLPASGSRRFLLGEAILGERGWQQALADCKGARQIAPAAGAAPVAGRSMLNFHPIRNASLRVRREAPPSRVRRLARSALGALARAHQEWRRLAGAVEQRLDRQRRVHAVRHAWQKTHGGRAVRFGAW